MNRTDMDKFNQLCIEYHVTKTQMIRSIINQITPPLPNKEMDEVINQLRHIGNNLNQLARSANASEEIDTLAYKQNVDMLYEVIVQIKEAISRPSGTIEVTINGDH